MGYLKYMRKAWEQPRKHMPELMRQRLIAWRQEPSTVRLAHPTRIDRARSLGYKAKEGFIVVRQRLPKRIRFRPFMVGGRRSKHARRHMIVAKTYQLIAEQRASQHYPNCEVFNSYPLAKDGKFHWTEVILIDRSHPQVQADINLRNIAAQHGRVWRGLTTAGKRSRGLLTNSGKGAEKLRPSLRAHNRTSK